MDAAYIACGETMSQSMVMTCLHCGCSRSVVWNASLVIQLSGREGQKQLMPFDSLVCSEWKEPEAGKSLTGRERFDINALLNFC